MALVKVRRPEKGNKWVGSPWLYTEPVSKFRQLVLPSEVPAHVKAGMGTDDVAWFPATWIAGRWNFAERVKPRDGRAPPHLCFPCEAYRQHRHSHETAHGIAGTHMHGSERFVCETCGHVTTAWHQHARSFPFRFDRPFEVVSSGRRSTQESNHGESTPAHWTPGPST